MVLSGDSLTGPVEGQLLSRNACLIQDGREREPAQLARAGVCLAPLHLICSVSLASSCVSLPSGVTHCRGAPF